MKTVAVLVGSLRRDSINRKFAEAVGKLASDRLEFKFSEIGDLPLYNDDLWANPPESVLRLKREIESADGVLFVTPEYNRSYTPALMNAINWANRPWGKNSWEAKPAAMMGATPGATGTAAGQNALRGLLNVIDMVLMGQPEVYFTYKPELFDADNNVADESTKVFLNRWIDRFTAWIERTSEPRTKAQADAA
ncbi:NADPH-dependent FMN reductase [Mangrovibrevibacter kandeliae]|uniref:NADPH-dependent FMN reductase n=1 Tax=Mangrovibrevibacter kandeliae TaxID=2968473 RepID=UPI00211822D7|nr:MULTISPECIES: NAD(P)H-dependent oxidoreductase [unclassified Aurantimonas]MCQ8783978.1 NAD(P)H-dependent oxidoreductase [Aurantimonas sp. CSK15Z-1]MCW4116695.1 NAD(P)H-dependent oxidoreductase [Aurantimonas sp. MSK8Z-1]